MTVLWVFVLLWTGSGSTSNPDTNIMCLIINLEYVNCTWAEGGVPQESYTFRGSFNSSTEGACPVYLKVGDVNVGCRFPMKGTEQFNPLHTGLYNADGKEVAAKRLSLIEYVKLNPAFNLSVEITNPELWLYWNVTKTAKRDCVESEVRYRINNKDWLTQMVSAGHRSFNVPFPNARRLYEFQVRVRIGNNCGLSKFWSDWSESICWGTLKDNNDTETRPSSSALLVVLYTLGAAVILIILSCLLVHSERLRVILVPVVPNAGKNFADLIENYDGNVEKWMNISKELQDGFKPNFTERTCPVREYHLLPQSSSSSDSSLSSLNDVSIDYQPMHSYSSASTLSASTSTTQATPTTPSGL